MDGGNLETVKVALQEKMAASEHFRTVELAATPGSSWGEGNPPFSAACISVRIWPATATAESALSMVSSESPAVWLALDLIAASGGVPVASQGEALVAGFPSFQSAILAARRLQWAMQGFSEAGEQQAVSLAVLVHSPEDAPNQAAGGALLVPGEQAVPGEILLTEKARQGFENLPGLPMMAAPGDDLRELLWRCPDEQATSSSDEEVLSQLIEEQGARSLPPEEPHPTVISDVGLAADAATSGLESFQPERPRGRSRWVMAVSAVTLVALAAGAFLYWSHQESAPAVEQSPAQTQTPVQTQTPPATTTNPPAAQGAQTPSTSPAQPAKLTRAEALAAAKAAKNGKGAAKPAEQQAEEKPQPEKPPPEKPPPPRPQPEAQRGHCELEQSQVNGQVDLAWKNLGRGKYADAKREFAAALACDPGNSRAKDGLERARASTEADGGSSN